MTGRPKPRSAELSPALRLRSEAARLASPVPALLIAAQRIAQTIIQGTHGRRTAGVGEEFWQYRLYTSGDPAQRIDWRKSARTHKVLVRENEWVAVNTLWLWADGGRGMAFRSHLAPVAKASRAMLIAMTLAVLAQRAGERIGLIGAPFAAGHTHATLGRIAAALAAESSPNLPPNARLNRFSSAVLVSDFLEPVDGLAAKLTLLAGQVQRGHLVQIADPAEEAFPYRGRIEFAEMGGAHRIVFGRVETLRDDYQLTYRRHRDAVRDLARRLGWTFTVHHTDQPPHRLLMALHALIAEGRHRVALAKGAA
ncbi:MAG: DUF58 domain-containing protein [Pseudomonadota bacterium]|nr:DUF58 domain-containing protein [Pseudomonadota bacterium]